MMVHQTATVRDQLWARALATYSGKLVLEILSVFERSMEASRALGLVLVKESQLGFVAARLRQHLGQWLEKRFSGFEEVDEEDAPGEGLAVN